MVRSFHYALDFDKVTTRFMESIHFLKIIFVSLLGEKSTGPSKFSLIYIFRLKSFNLVLNPRAKSDGHRGTWTACTKIQQNLQGCTSTGLFLIKLQVYNRANASLKLYQKKATPAQVFFC